MFEQPKKILSAAFLSIAAKTLAPLEVAAQDLKNDNKGMTGLIITGILTTIIGFVMLVVGIYIYYTVQTTLPAPWQNFGAQPWTPAQNASATSYNSTTTTVNTYAGTVFPLMGIVLMVMGFVIILIALKMAGGGMGATGMR